MRTGDEVLLGLEAKEPVGLGERLGVGASASVFGCIRRRATSQAPLVLKVYRREPPENLAERVAFAREHLQTQIFTMIAGQRSPLFAAPRSMVLEAKSRQIIGVACLRLPASFGWSVDNFLRSAQRSDIRQATKIAIGLSESVLRLHREGYVVGDFSPNNFLLTSTGTVGCIDIDSFGFQIGPRLLAPTHETPEYRAPVATASTSSDEWALGVLIVHLLLGMHPYGGRSNVTDGPISVAGNIGAGASWLKQPGSFNLPPHMDGHPGIDVLPPQLWPYANKVLPGSTFSPASAQQWATSLSGLLESIVECSNCGANKFNRGACAGSKCRQVTARWTTPNHSRTQPSAEAFGPNDDSIITVVQPPSESGQGQPPRPSHAPQIPTQTQIGLNGPSVAGSSQPTTVAAITLFSLGLLTLAAGGVLVLVGFNRIVAGLALLIAAVLLVAGAVEMSRKGKL